MNLKKGLLPAIAGISLSASIYTHCFDYKQSILKTTYSFVGLYSALKSLEAAASSFITLDYQLEHNINNAPLLSRHILNAARITFFTIASTLSLKEAYKLSKVKAEEKT